MRENVINQLKLILYSTFITPKNQAGPHVFPKDANILTFQKSVKINVNQKECAPLQTWFSTFNWILLRLPREFVVSSRQGNVLILLSHKLITPSVSEASTLKRTDGDSGNIRNISYQDFRKLKVNNSHQFCISCNYSFGLQTNFEKKTDESNSRWDTLHPHLLVKKL